MDDLLAQFLIEGPELVQEGGDALLALEARPDDRDLIDRAFRAMHTLKGSVGLFDLPAMGRLLHAAEDALGDLRVGRRVVDADLISALLAVLSQSERWLAELQRTGGLPADADARASALMGTLTDGPDRAAPARMVTDAAWAMALAAAWQDGTRALVAVRYRPDAGSYFSGDDPVAIVQKTPGLLHLELGVAAGPTEGPYDPFLCRLTLDLLSEAPLDDVRAAFRFVADQVEIQSVAPGGADAVAKAEPAEYMAARTLRIDPRRVDTLAATAADLVTAKTGISALAALAAAGGDPRVFTETLSARAKALERLASRLHDDVMALRMTPIAPLLRRYPRIARDLAGALGKDVEFVVEDGGLDADKAIIEGLADPLTHLLRNAIDHGVEHPAERERVGKPARAVVRLTARAEGPNLLLDLRDDGRGVDPAALRRKVVERGLMPAEQLADMSDAAVLELIFLPGLSTAAIVTEVSGRGVGMDAVKTAVARLGGRVHLDSEVGSGTCVTLSLPLSVVLTKIMIVEADGERFAAPMDRVLETLKLAPERVFAIRAGRAFDWRGRATPLLSLSSLVGHDDRKADGEDLRVLVVQCGSQVVGVCVDAIVDRTDVVLRPLTGLLAATPGVIGSTVQGDGQVLMVLDIAELVG